MVRSCIWLLSLGLLLAAAQSSWAEKQRTRNSTRTPAKQTANETGLTTKVHSLADLGDDPNLCKWIAETIPQVIRPESWVMHDCVGDSTPRVVVNAPAKILVVCQTSAVQMEVDAFLQNVAQTVAQNKQRNVPATTTKFAKNSSVVPAQFVTPTDVGTTTPVPYPVPQHTQQPKHLFHFIIRYEGDGVIDANVADYLKAVYGNLSGDQKTRIGDPMVGEQKVRNNDTYANSYSSEPCVPTFMTPSGPVCVPGAVCPPSGFGANGLTPAYYPLPAPLAAPGSAPWLPSGVPSMPPGHPEFGVLAPSSPPTIPRPNDTPVQMPRADD